MKFKKKRNVKFRGSKTHGWGSMKKHRGSGNRGGFGMAGTGKRAKQLKTLVIKLYGNEYFGKRGFKKAVKKYSTMNISYLNEHIESFLKQGLASKEGDTFILHLEKLNSKKLLGKGNLSYKMKIHAHHASANAIKKIKQAGGEVILQQ